MSAVRTAAFDLVIARFYEAVGLPELLPSALHELALACGAAGAALNLSNGLETRASIGSEDLTELRRDFMTHWRAPELNSHRARGLDLNFRGWQNTLTEQDCFTAEELKRDPFQQELFVGNGFYSFAGNILARVPGSSLSLSIIRRIDQGRYEPDEIDQINRLAAHLRAAGTLAMRVGITSSQRIAEVLARDGQPAALLGHDGRILYMSGRFEQLTGDGLLISDGRLGARHIGADGQIKAAVTRALNADDQHGFRQIVVLPRRDGVTPLIVTVVPLVGQAHDVLSLASAVVLLTALEERPPGPETLVLQQVFGLTQAEAKLAQQIAIGQTLPEIAACSGLSYQTLRSQLKAIFNKTGATRQAELAVLLARLPAPR